MSIQNKNLDDEYGVTVCQFEKNSHEEIRISINEYKGTKYTDIRTFYFDENESCFKPTRRGITFNVECYQNFLNCVLQLGEALGYDFENKE